MENELPESLQPFMGRIEPVIQDALTSLAKTEFRTDPIGGKKYSRATSIISSAYKRHGQILGRALIERLQDCSRFTVWTENSFKLSFQSDNELRKSFPPVSYRQMDLPYGEEDRSIMIDMIIFDHDSGSLRSYNVKRGNGAYDAGKKRLIFHELLKTQMLLREYGKSVGIDADSAESFIIFYYGIRSIPEPYSLIDQDLDKHFDFPVIEAIEAANNRFRQGLYELIEKG
jgi:hypothetical protein